MLVAILLTATPAWAAGGWYLLVPPRNTYDEHAQFLSGYKILDNKPLSEWAQVAAFDSASDCEATRSALTLAEQNIYHLDLNDYQKAIGERKAPEILSFQRYNTEVHNANISAYSASRCIRSDDPRLGGSRERTR